MRLSTISSTMIVLIVASVIILAGFGVYFALNHFPSESSATTNSCNLYTDYCNSICAGAAWCGGDSYIDCSSITHYNASSCEGISSSASITATYNAPIMYRPPWNETVKNEVGNCGIYAMLDSPSDTFVPYATTVVVTFYGIFNGTSSCPLLQYLKVSVSLGANISSSTFYATTRLLLVSTEGNSSVYAASFTFTSFYTTGNTFINPAQLSSEYQSEFAQVSIQFNMLPVSTTTSETYVNDTTFTVTPK